ncbi:MAG: GntR family transcriptional regulator [Gammaproteobacteria bacterium]
MKPPTRTKKPAAQALPKRRTATRDQAIYDAVYDAIMDHRLPPGTKLTEAAFCDFFGVSRTVVRKALVRLAHDGMVTLRLNRGAVVASPSIEETHDVFEARRVIESALIHSLTHRANAEQLRQLHVIAEDEQAALERGDRRAAVRLSGEFHLRLATLGGNAVLSQFLNELITRTSLIIALYETPGTSACLFDDHFALIDAIASGDAERAATQMEAHLRACEARLNLKEKGKPVELADIFGKPSAAETLAPLGA